MAADKGWGVLRQPGWGIENFLLIFLGDFLAFALNCSLLRVVSLGCCPYREEGLEEWQHVLEDGRIWERWELREEGGATGAENGE